MNLKISLFSTARIIVTGLIFAYLAATLDWKSILGNLLKIDPMYLVFGEVAFLTSLVLASFRWWILLRVQRIVLHFRLVNRLTFVSQFFNLFLLGSIGGDASKLILLAKYIPTQKTHAAISIFMDRAIGLAVLLCFVVAVFPLQVGGIQAGQDSQSLYEGLWGALLLLIFSLVFVMYFPFERIVERSDGLIDRLVGHRLVILSLQGIQQHRQAKGLAFAAISISVLIWAFVFAGGYWEARAMHLEVDLMQLITMLAVVILVSSLPISIGGHGVREGSFIVMFSLYGLVPPPGFNGQQEAAVAFSLLFFAMWALWGLAGGVVFLSHRNKGSAPQMDTKAS